MAVIGVTGGTGFIGSHLARALVEQGHFVKLIARGIAGREDPVRQMQNVNFTPVKLTEERLLFQALGGCDALVHLIGINREHQPGEFEKVHVQGTQTIVSNALRAQVKKVVFVSYFRARRSRTSQYTDTKFRAEEIVRNSPFDWTIIRPGMCFGKGDQMISNIVHALEAFPVGIWPTTGILEKKVNPLAVEDLVRVIVAACADNRLTKQTVSVNGPDNITLSQAVQRVARVIRKPTIIIPAFMAQHYLLALTMQGWEQPLVTIPQLQMLGEGFKDPLPDSDLLPSDLLPQIHFDEESIRAALP